MPVINLIQEQRMAMNRVEQRSRVALLTLVGSGVVSVLAYGVLMLQGQSLNTQVTRLNTELQKLSPVIAQITKNEQETSQLKPHLDTLQEAQKMSDRWAHILQHLETQTPANTWLTAMQASALQADKPTTLVIQGLAHDQEPIGEFVLRVENDPDLENVALHFTQEKKTPGAARSISFEVGADLAGTAQQKAKDEESKS